MAEHLTAPHARHAQELAYLFDQLEARYPGAILASNDRAMARTFHRYFVNFARTGDPNGAELPPWPRYDLLMQFTAKGAQAGPDPWKDRLQLIERAWGRP